MLNETAMPVNVQEVETNVDSSEEDGSEATLGPTELRQLAELIYKLMKEDLRIERERLGR